MLSEPESKPESEPESKISLHHMPYDIQYAIAEFICDIDIRRHYKIYRTINLQPFYKFDFENIVKNKYRIRHFHSRFSFPSNFL